MSHRKPMSERVHGLMATYRAGCHCAECRAVKNKRDRDLRHRLKADYPVANQPIVVPTINVTTAQNPANRPPHYPPPCPACGGFGYVAASHKAWSTCRACRAHPGHACTHAEWTALRA